MEIKRRRKKVKEGFNKLSFCFQRTNWCSLRECFETEKSRWETFRGESDPIELWLVAGVVEEKEKKKEKKKKSIELSAFFPFFTCLFIPLKFEPSVHIGGNLRKALPLQASETIVSFRGWAGFMEVAAWNFATRPGKAVFHREISLFIGRIESIGCLVILSNRFHAQTLVIFPCFREPLVGDRYFYPLFLSFSFFPPPLFLTNILSCLYLRACFGVKDGAGTNERRTKRRK